VADDADGAVAAVDLGERRTSLRSAMSGLQKRCLNVRDGTVLDRIDRSKFKPANSIAQPHAKSCQPMLDGKSVH
jgi:hypothetical protein